MLGAVGGDVEEVSRVERELGADIPTPARDPPRGLEEEEELGRVACEIARIRRGRSGFERDCDSAWVDDVCSGGSVSGSRNAPARGEGALAGGMPSTVDCL